MAFREVAVPEIREALRAWLDGAGLRRVAERAGVDRKTARRYVEAAVSAMPCPCPGGRHPPSPLPGASRLPTLQQVRSELANIKLWTIT